MCEIFASRNFSYCEAMGQVPTKEGNDNLQQVLESYEQEHIYLDVNFLNQALVAATLNDNHGCIGKLIKMGATNVDECIQLSKEKGTVNTLAMLFLMKAALTGNERFLKQEMACHDLELPNNSFLHCHIVHIMKHSSTIDALEVAQRCGQHAVHRKLMVLTSSSASGWSKLNLMHIDVRVLEMSLGSQILIYQQTS